MAVFARAPKQRSLQRIEGVSLTEDELRQLMRTAVGHRLFPLLWLTAMTGMRRNEVLGLKWPDIDFKKKRLHLNRGLGAFGIDARAARRAAQLQLAAQVPAVVLAETLGVTINTATDWVHAAGGDWANYAAVTAADTGPT